MPAYEVGDFVWAKVRGHAWWPAKVGKVCDVNAASTHGGKPS